MTQTKKKRSVKRDAFSVLARAVGRYLKQQGWNVLVVGPVRVEHRPTDRILNHECVVRFTGSRIPEKKGR